VLPSRRPFRREDHNILSTIDLGLGKTATR